MNTTKHGNTGKKNAIKSKEKKAESHLHIRCKGVDMDVWREMAKSNNLSLSKWAISRLNSPT